MKGVIAAFGGDINGIGYIYFRSGRSVRVVFPEIIPALVAAFGPTLEMAVGREISYIVDGSGMLVEFDTPVRPGQNVFEEDT